MIIKLPHAKNDQVTRRYSEGFKRKVLYELSSGKY